MLKTCDACSNISYLLGYAKLPCRVIFYLFTLVIWFECVANINRLFLEIKQNKLCICVHFYPLLLWGYLELSEINSRCSICFSAACHYTIAEEEGFLAVFHLLWPYGTNGGMLQSPHQFTRTMACSCLLLYCLLLFSTPEGGSCNKFKSSGS